MAFLVGQDASPSKAVPLTVFGSPKAGQYAFAVIVTAGYWAGDYIGHREFHERLYRLALLVIAVVAADLVVARMA
ncbi:MAG: hypothetical protein AB7O43_10210 [Hyphomicrobiaceae bacterium]